MNNKKKIFIKVSLVIISLFLPFSVKAAVLFLDPTTGTYQSGETFILTVKIDPENECLNAVEVNVSFPPELLLVQQVSQGNSIMPLWLAQPTLNQSAGLISLAGIIPGGYCGRLTGDAGPSDILAQLVFKATLPQNYTTTTSQAEIKFLDSSQVLLNDGEGTKANLTFKSAKIEISKVTTEAINLWQKEISADKTPPEPFSLYLSRESSLFDGKYFISWSTTDKQTGVDYYEVKEGKKSSWRKAESPYLLVDQGIRDTIEVRAVDKAGNQTIAELKPAAVSAQYKNYQIWSIMILLAIIAFILLVLWQKRRKTKRQS